MERSFATPRLAPPPKLAAHPVAPNVPSLAGASLVPFASAQDDASGARPAPPCTDREDLAPFQALQPTPLADLAAHPSGCLLALTKSDVNRVINDVFNWDGVDQ